MPEHKAWLQQAEADLIVARIILETNNHFIISALLFHAQQCSEKALKAYLIFKKQPMKKTHDLVALVEICSKLDKDFLTLLPNAQELNPFAIDCRYPDSNFLIPDVSVAQHSLNLANEVIEFVRTKID